MTVIRTAVQTSREALETYSLLVRIVVPVAIATELMVRMGLLEALSPLLAPVMSLYGLPAGFGLAWLTGMLVGIWGAIPIVLALMPASSMTVADITVFSALLLFAHGLPVEQRIIQKAGPGFFVTMLMRVAGGMIYAGLLRQIFIVTGWLSEPLNPTWMPISGAADWLHFFAGLAWSLAAMLIILVVLAWTVELLRVLGLMDLLMKVLNPMLGLAGIHGQARQFTTIGLLLGISYGGGMLIRQARTGGIEPRQVFLSCTFMGFAHSVIEDTAIVMTLGADLTAILSGRLVFAVAATALIGWLIWRLSDETFFAWMFRSCQRTSGAAAR